MRPALAVLLASAVAGAATVRTDRPRMLLSNGTGRGTPLATFVARCTTDPAYKQRCTNALNAGGGSYPAINDAAGYLVNNDAARCTAAYNTLQTVAADTPGMPDPHSFISNNQRVMLQLTVVRDWCDPVLTQPQKDWIESTIVAWADWYSGTRGGYALEIWHDDFNNVWNSVALAGLALKGTAQDAKADGYLMAADTTWKNTIFPALKYEGDFWHEGFTYVQPAVGSAIVYATAWSVATDEDIFAYAKQNAGDVFNGWLMMHAYLMRPDYRYAYFGDSSDNKQSIELFSRALIDMLTQGTGNMLGQGLSLEIKANSRPGYDYSGADGYLPALFYDATKDSQAIARSTLPKTRWISPGAADVLVMRSGWSSSDTWVVASCGDWFGSHQKIESGQFQIFHRAILTTSSGYYDNFDTDHWQNWFSQHSVHANTIAVYEPTEFFPTTSSIQNASANVNEGGQRVLRRSKNGSAFPNPDLPTYLMHKSSPPYTETGDVKLFKDDGCVTWASCDLTAAYDSPGFTTNGNLAKVDEVVRQFVWVPPDTLVVWDWVESTDAGYEKRWLLQTPPSPQVNGNAYTLQNDGGTLFAQTVLPAGATVTTIPNFTIDGVSHAPNPGGLESFGTRLEIKPAAPALRDYFLHVFSTAASAPVVSVLSQTADAVQVKIDRGTDQVTLSLTKNKAQGLGGTATISAGGSTTCTSNTLDGGSGGGAGGGGGSASGGGSAGGGSATGGGGTSSTGGGAGGGGGGGGSGPVKSSCGCDTGDGLWLGLLLLPLARRRRGRLSRGCTLAPSALPTGVHTRCADPRNHVHDPGQNRDRRLLEQAACLRAPSCSQRWSCAPAPGRSPSRR